jgi:integrase
MSLNKFTKRLCEKAEVPLFTLHQFRHLAATLLNENKELSLSQVQQFLRHDHKSTTELYTGHLDISTSKQSEYLGNFWSGKLSEAADAK